MRSYRTISPLPQRALLRTLELRRYIFCATFLQVTLTGSYPAHCPTEFGLSSPPTQFLVPARRSSSGLRRIVKELINKFDNSNLNPATQLRLAANKRRAANSRKRQTIHQITTNIMGTRQPSVNLLKQSLTTNSAPTCRFSSKLFNQQFPKRFFVEN